MKSKIAILIALSILFACKKNHGIKKAVSTNLTDCLAHHYCNYNYFDHADFSGNQIKGGSNRVFVYGSIDSAVCDLSKQLFFKTPLSDADFTINASQIAAGQALYFESCACCDFGYTPKAIGGEIKGTKTTGENWLINATVILADPNNKPVDTLVINQIFAPTLTFN